MEVLGGGVLLVVGERRVCLVSLVDGEVWPLAVELEPTSAAITATLLLSAHISTHVRFRSALLSHVIGVDSDVLVLLLGLADGSLLWLPLSTSVATKPQIYFLCRRSQSAIVRLSVVSVSSSSVEGVAAGGGINDNFRICVIHDNSSIAFLQASAESSGDPIHLPVSCLPNSIVVWEGLVFALTKGGVLVAFTLLQRPAAPVFIASDQSAVVLSGPNMKKILFFMLLHPPTVDVKGKLFVCFADGVRHFITLPSGNQREGIEARELPDHCAGLTFTTHQAHQRTSRDRLHSIHTSFSQLGAFVPLRKLKHSDINHVAAEEAAATAIRSILSSITDTNGAKELVLEKKALLDEEILRSAALVQQLQVHEGNLKKAFNVQLDISSGKSVLANVRSNEYYGTITFSTTSESAVRAVQGRTLRTSWRCCLHVPGTTSATQAHTYTCPLHFMPSLFVGGSNTGPTFSCKVIVPLQIDIAAPHELELELLVNPLYPTILFSSHTALLRSEIKRDEFGFSVVGAAKKYDIQTAADRANRDASMLLDIPFINIKKSLSEILHATRGYLLQVVPELNTSQTIAGGSTSVGTKLGSQTRLGEVLGRRVAASRQSPHFSLTSYIPVVTGDPEISALLHSDMMTPVKDVEESLRSLTGIGDGKSTDARYSYKTTNMPIRQPFPSADEHSVPITNVKVLHHKSNSKLTLSLLQADLNLRLGKVLTRHLASVVSEQPPSPSRFEDRDVYSMPYELQQVMQECQSIQYKLRKLASSHQRDSNESEGSRCVFRSNELLSDMTCPDVDDSNLHNQRDALNLSCARLWEIYQMVREYGV